MLSRSPEGHILWGKEEVWDSSWCP